MKDYKAYIPIDNIELIEDENLEMVQKGLIYDHEISVREDKIILHYPHTIFTIEKGYLINYRKLKIDEHQFIEQLSTSVYAAILFQREIIPFHASSFYYRNKGIMLCANSEVGKSSLAFSFLNEGSSLLCDDITPIITTNQLNYISPNSTSIKLWEDSLIYFQLKQKEHSKLVNKKGKFKVAIDTKQNPLNKYQLDLIFIMTINKEDQFDYYELTGAEKVQSLIEQLFRIRYLKANINQKEEIFKKVITIAKKTKVVELLRPLDAKIEETKNFIKQIIDEEIF